MVAATAKRTGYPQRQPDGDDIAICDPAHGTQ